MIRSIKIRDEEYTFETGKWGKQANGSIVLKWKNIILMANVCATKEAREDTDFLPLTVDFRERYYAAGQFAGGYIKREGRPSTKEILISRLIDRPCAHYSPRLFLMRYNYLLHYLVPIKTNWLMFMRSLLRLPLWSFPTFLLMGLSQELE